MKCKVPSFLLVNHMITRASFLLERRGWLGSAFPVVEAFCGTDMSERSYLRGVLHMTHRNDQK